MHVHGSQACMRLNLINICISTSIFNVESQKTCLVYEGNLKPSLFPNCQGIFINVDHIDDRWIIFICHIFQSEYHALPHRLIKWSSCQIEIVNMWSTAYTPQPLPWSHEWWPMKQNFLASISSIPSWSTSKISTYSQGLN